MTDEIFRDKLYEQMTKQNLSAEDVACLAECSASSVRRWIRCDTSPLPLMKQIVMRVLKENDD